MKSGEGKVRSMIPILLLATALTGCASGGRGVGINSRNVIVVESENLEENIEEGRFASEGNHRESGQENVRGEGDSTKKNLGEKPKEGNLDEENPADKTDEEESLYDDDGQLQYAEKRMGDGLRLIIKLQEQLKPGEAGDFSYEVTYEVTVWKDGEGKPVQVFSVASAMQDPFSVEDFNADGYPDLTCLYYYGANGGTAEHYLWCPSRQQFVKGPGKLEYFGYYRVDEEKRILYLHIHGSAISGEEYAYQWTGETECEQIKYFSHDYDHTSGKVKVYITALEDGIEKVLSDCAYYMEEYEAKGDMIWQIFYCDFVWQQTFSDAEGRKYQVLFAQQAGGDCVYDFVYVFDKDTRMIQGIMDQVDRLYRSVWFEEEGMKLVVTYEDGDEKEYPLLGE